MLGWVTAGSAVLGYLGSQDAADTAADASRYGADTASATQQRMYDLTRYDQAPWREAGVNALSRLTQGTQPGGEFDRGFTNADFLANQDPGYGFRMSEGLKALDRTAAQRGGLLSGQTLKAAQGFGQNLASEEYQNAFNRYQANRANRLQPLQSLAGIGQTATNALGVLGANTASNIGNYAMTNAGNQGNAALYANQASQSAFGGAANMLGRFYAGGWRPGGGMTQTYADPYIDPTQAGWYGGT